MVIGGVKMAQLKSNSNSRRSLQEVIANHPSATTNKMGALAFEYDSPAEFLLGTIGSAMFTEPKFYADVDNLEELKKRSFSVDGLDEQAVKILNACFQVAEGDNPRDLLALAHWARKELNMRTTPQIMLAVAAHCAKTKSFVRKYVQDVALRADEVKQVVGAYEHLFGWGAFPACLKKGISERMSRLTEYEILKYNTKSHPSFADILRFCHRKKGYPLSQPLREYIMSGEVIDSDATPMIAARKELNSRREWSEEVPALAKAAGATWENLISQFGSDARTWEAIAPQMGYMALLRNLGNLLDANVSDACIQAVAEKLSNPHAVEKSKQLPFRFLSAYKTLNPEDRNEYGIYRIMRGRAAQQRDRSRWNQRKVAVLTQAVTAALDHSVANVPELPGATLIAIDNSGSMSNPLSKDSVRSIRDVANLLGAMLHRRCEDAEVVSFGENVVHPELSSSRSVLENAVTIFTDHNRKGGGHSTNAWKVIQLALTDKRQFNRIVVLSDMQCYDTSNHRMSVGSLLAKYRDTVSAGCFAHFFDLAGYGTRQTPGSNLDNVVAGFSDKILNQILVAEGGAVEAVKSDGTPVLPTLDYVRENF